jgi:hypothetical protein
MAAEYRLDIKTAAGVLVAQVTDFLALTYTKRVNQPGTLSFVLAGDHSAIAQLAHNGQVEVWRRDPVNGIAWYCDHYSLYRAQERQYTDHDVFTARCPGQLSMLDWRIVAWPAGTANRSVFASAKAETILKTLVTYNAGASATTANGRIRNGAITGISSAADAAGGNTLDWSCAWKGLLETLQDIALVAGGDFDLVKTGAQAWEFRFYAGQLGTDRSATVAFAVERGNMANPVYTYNRTDERSVAIVAGQGQESSRSTAVRTGAYYSATNDVETFVDGRNTATAAGLNALGDKVLSNKAPVQSFEFDVLQTPSCLYGSHYFVGDLVTARYDSIEATRKVLGVQVTLDTDGGETVAVATGNT